MVMKVRNLLSKSFTSQSSTAAPPKKKQANVAAFTQWSARMNNSAHSSGGVSSGGDLKGKASKNKSGGNNNPRTGPIYRSRATAETAPLSGGSICSSHSDYGDTATADLDDSNSTNRDRELENIRYHAQHAGVVLARRTGSGAGPATLSVSTGDLEESSQGATAEAEEEEFFHSSYISFVEECLESFMNSTVVDTIDPEDDDEEEVGSTGTDHSAYYSGSDAILVWTSEQEDVSTLGGESQLLMEGGEVKKLLSRPPVLELDVDASSDNSSVASEVTYGSCETVDDVEDDWSLAVKASFEEKSHLGPSNTRCGSTQEQEEEAHFPLVAMSKQLQRSRDDLACVLHDLLLNSTNKQDQLSKKLKESSNILLAECDALLMQLVTLSFKKNSSMIAKLKMCQEITLRECEDLLVQLKELRVAVVRRWVASKFASGRSSNDCFKSILCIQAFGRCTLQRRRYEHALESVAMIQGLVRGWHVRKSLPANKLNKPCSKKRVAGTGLDRLSSLGKKVEKKHLTLHEETMNKLRAEYFRLSQQSNSLPKNSPEWTLAKQEMELIARNIMDLYKQELLTKSKKCLASKKKPYMKGKNKRRGSHKELGREYLDNINE